LKHLFIGLVLFGLIGWLLPPRILKTHAYPILILTCLALLLVLILGKIGGGSQRWIVIGPFRGQPSELAKITVAIIVSRFFATSNVRFSYRIQDLWPIAALVGLIIALIFPQPDFGTAGFCLLIAVAQILFVRLNWRSVGLAVAICLASAPIAWTFLLKDYQKSRVLSFLDPTMDPHGKGYNAIQSLIAVGSGGSSGKGFLQGTQTQLQFLPMRHTDFIFSVFAEEHGYWGCTILFLLFAGIAYVGLEIARQSKDTFNALLAVGLTSFIFIEFTINVAMVLRMFPVVGLPLPFFSYGGSALITVCVALGILVSIDRDSLGLFDKPNEYAKAVK